MSDSQQLDYGAGPGEDEMRQLIAKAQAAFAWRASIEELTGSASVEGVEVTVANNGRVQSLDVSDGACRDGGPQLAARVLAALHAAQDDLSVRLRESATEAFGPDSDQTDQVSAAARAKMGRASLLGDDEEPGARGSSATF